MTLGFEFDCGLSTANISWFIILQLYYSQNHNAEEITEM